MKVGGMRGTWYMAVPEYSHCAFVIGSDINPLAEAVTWTRTPGETETVRAYEKCNRLTPTPALPCTAASTWVGRLQINALYSRPIHTG